MMLEEEVEALQALQLAREDELADEEARAIEDLADIPEAEEVEQHLKAHEENCFTVQTAQMRQSCHGFMRVKMCACGQHRDCMSPNEAVGTLRKSHD